MEEVFKYKGEEYFVDKNIIIKDDEDEEKIWHGIKELTTKKYVGLKNGDIIHFFKDEEDEKESDNLKITKLLENLQIISIEEIKFLKKKITIKEIVNQHIQNLRDRAKIILELLESDYNYYNKNDIRYKNDDLKEIRKKKRLLLLNLIYGL